MRTFFDVLGIERRYHLDAAELERRYLELSKQHHPDRHARAEARQRTQALLATTELNDAYRVLKNNVKRGEYLLKLEGIDVAEETPSREVDPTLLGEVMELREALAEARMDGDQAKIDALTLDVRARRQRALDEVDDGFGAYERGDRGELPAIARALVSLRYYARFLDEVEKGSD